ncbi:hypothetical protein BDN71DRAFT_1454959 [Pleurotus eryngii]|uniref:Uncharacterized protein n=1 Tax=Pleurotus eryngii TaxID=5323 RepID=A0A9P6DBX2_PLEER|nr:hypothetical protein BDN71DRAFT_1454959 [Pleurotus eryngii]
MDTAMCHTKLYSTLPSCSVVIVLNIMSYNTSDSLTSIADRWLPISAYVPGNVCRVPTVRI